MTELLDRHPVALHRAGQVHGPWLFQINATWYVDNLSMLTGPGSIERVIGKSLMTTG